MLNIIKQKGQKEPYVLILGSFKEPKQSFLIIDGEVVSEIDIRDIPLAHFFHPFLFSTYATLKDAQTFIHFWNMLYSTCATKGCHHRLTTS